MGINGFGPTLPPVSTIPKAANSHQSVIPKKNTDDSADSIPDVFEHSEKKQRYSADISRMREIWTEHDRQVVAFQRLVDSLLQRQANEASQAGIEWDFSDPNAMVNIDEETRTAAQDAISEGGYFSVDAVATRLLDFAVAISGGDPSRIEVLRDAVQRGFDAASQQWGGELPEISQHTLEAVMNGFDEWLNSGSASSITLLHSSD